MNETVRERLVGTLTDAAVEVAARRGVRGSVDLELAVWQALDRVQPRRASDDYLAQLTEAAYRVTLARGPRAPFLDLEMDLWRTFRQTANINARR
jgi:hypothetical protein